MKPCPKLIKAGVVYLSRGIINREVRIAITSGIISEDSLISLGINYALSQMCNKSSTCRVIGLKIKAPLGGHHIAGGKSNLLIVKGIV